MKRFFIILPIFTLVFTTIYAQSAGNNYDSVLAKKLNADDYGMKHYVFVILKTGSNTSENKEAIDSAFSGHMKNIQRLADNNKLVVAGPFGKNNNNFRGLFILNTNSIDEAKSLLETDPAIKAKYLEPELYLWYGSAALQETLQIHEKIQKLHF
jgi:uncharacterized protein YciI